MDLERDGVNHDILDHHRDDVDQCHDGKLEKNRYSDAARILIDHERIVKNVIAEKVQWTKPFAETETYKSNGLVRVDTFAFVIQNAAKKALTWATVLDVRI